VKSFEELIADAQQWSLHGWDFSELKGRWQEQEPPWDYRDLVLNLIPKATQLLDMGTGGGEFLAKLPKLPEHVFATEAWPPNVPIARQRLEPLGIEVAHIHDDVLPYSDDQFDLIINRHESFKAQEVFRTLAPGGIFLTQQVGGQDNIAINQTIDTTASNEFADWGLGIAIKQLQDAGFTITHQRQAFPKTVFYDVGALILYLKAIPWQIPNFTIEKYEPALKRIDATIRDTGKFVSKAHRFVVIACKN